MAANSKNWAALLPELIPIIAKKITDISDFIRFRAVCKNWHSSTTIADLPPQFPWILSNNCGPDLQFYSIALDKSFTIHAPKFSNKHFFDSCRGYMLVRSADFKCISLINPLTNIEISLPPLGYGYYKWIGSRNFQNGDYVIMKDYDCRKNSLYVCKPGDEKWIRMKGGDYYYLYTNNLLYKAKATLIPGKTGEAVYVFTEVIDVSTHENIYVVPEKQVYLTLLNEDINLYLWCSSILVESQGEILKVIYIGEFEKYEIVRLEFQNGKENPCWVKITNTGDSMLFLDFYHHYGDFSLRAADFHGYGFNFKGNCIYTIRQYKRPSCDHSSYRVERYDIESGITELIHCAKSNLLTWFLPSLNHV